jgi:ABC-type branched-subunit amino acid transport system substrate-binding protein
VKRRKLVASVAVVAVIAAIVTTGTAGARVHAAEVRGVTDTEIKVAGLGQAANFADSQVGAQARFDEEGDVFGRKITVTEFADDNNDPNTLLSEAKRLVQQEGSFALLPLMTPNLNEATATFLAQQHVPFLGWGIAQPWCQNPYGFPFTGCIVPPTGLPNTGDTWGALIDQLFKSRGDAKGGKGKTAAVITEDNATAQEGLKEISFQAKKGGHMKVVYAEAAIPATPPGDYSPFANDIMTSNNGGPPDVVFETVSFSNLLGLSKALIDAGFTGVLTNAVAYDPRLVAPAKGQTVFTQFDLPEDAGNAKMQSIVAAIKASAGDDVLITQGVLSGYFTADLFVSILKKVGKNLTAEKFAKVASKFTYEVPGTVGPTKWPKAFEQGAPCGTLAESDGTVYTLPVPYKCYSNFNYETGKKLKY